MQTPFQWVMLAMGLLTAFGLPFFLPLSALDFLIRGFITVIAVLGLTLLTGNCGQVSLGHTAFMAVGAFAGAILLEKGVPLLLALPIAGLSGGIVGLVFGIPALRMKGFYLAFSTLAAFYIVRFVLVHYVGGDMGYAVEPPRIFAFGFDSDIRIYYLIATVCLVMTYFTKNIIRCKWGRAFVAIRDHDIAAHTLGVNIYFYKLAAFFIGCFYASVAGFLLSIYMGWASVDHYSLYKCIWFLGMIVVGGMSTIGGAYLGVFFILGIEEIGTIIGPQLSQMFPQVAGTIVGAVPIIFVGIVLMLFILFEPKGLAYRWEIMKAATRLFPFSH